MGTRADFYIANTDGLDWLGSIAWDGYPDGIDSAVIEAKSADTFRAALAAFFSGRDDVTLPEQGWPWPWNTSDTTDYGYVLIEGRGVFFRAGGGKICSAADEIDEEGERASITGVSFEYPDMSAIKAATLGKRSGLLIFTAP